MKPLFRRRHFPEECPGSRFTLVEMLVVIAIIGILVALLLPGLRQSLNSARTTSCAGNLRQLTIWGQNYADNWNGVLPHNGQLWIGPFNGYSSVSTTGWTEKYKIDLNQNVAGLRCPQTAADLGSGGVYGLNCYMGGCRVQNATNPAIPLKRLKDLRTRAYWWGDAGAQNDSGIWNFGPFLWPNSWAPHGMKYHGPYMWFQAGVEGHLGREQGSNFIFGDGHLEVRGHTYYYTVLTTQEKRTFNGGYY